jgi:hypothetical protein
MAEAGGCPLPPGGCVSISSVSSSAATTIQELAKTILDRFDANKDYQLSFGEFATFLEGFTDAVTGGSTTATAAGSTASATSLFLTTTADSASASSSAATYLDRMLGFNGDLIREGTGSTKYDAALILQHYDPNDPTAMQKVYEEMQKLHPGTTSLDIHNDLMLDGTEDGYVGRRPLNRDEDWSNPPSGWVWQWMAYNDDHPVPQA